MKSSIWQPFYDRTNLFLVISALVTSGLVFYLYRTLFYHQGNIWLVPAFTQVYIFVIVLFVINFALGFISFKRDRHLSYIFNGLTISCCTLFLLAMILNINNPNG